MAESTRSKSSQHVAEYTGRGGYNSNPDSRCDIIQYWDENRSLQDDEANPVTVLEALKHVAS